MDWSKALLQVIDLRSFSSVWYWMAVAVVWSSVSHFVLGVPYDLIQRARRHGDQAERDLQDIVRVNVNRLLHISDTAGLFLIGFAAFSLTGLAVLAFYYWVELAQAILLIAFPLAIVGMISIRTARRISANPPSGDELFAALFRHRLWTQAVGMAAIFVTAMFGMYEALDVVRYL